MYVSITRFKVKAWWAIPLFQFHAFRSHRQANRTKGIVAMEVWAEKGNVFCTLTHWESEEDMVRFRNSGSHSKAMKTSHKIGRGVTTGWGTLRRVRREEARQRLHSLFPLISQLV